MSEEEKREETPPEEETLASARPAEEPKKKAPKPPTSPPSPAPPKPSPKKEKVMAQPHKEGAGNFLALMALAVALGSLVLTAFFAYSKARPASTAKWAAELQKTTTQEINALTARMVDLEASIQDLKAQRGRATSVETLDLKKALVSLREVGLQTTGETRERVQQVEGALKALINDLEAKSQ